MPALTTAELRSRLLFDREVMEGLQAPWLRVIPAVSAADARDGRAAPQNQFAFAYRVDYGFDVPIGPGRAVRTTQLVFDLLAGGTYPYSPPSVQAVSWPLPWSPHVHPHTGVVCIGTAWNAASGRMLLAQLAIHCARLLNCDERPGHGWNSEAYEYWRTHLRFAPVNPGLEYPTLPLELTHNAADGTTSGLHFRGVQAPGLRIVGRVR